MSDARVLVTGGAGFIGSHLVDRLLDDGATVTVLDDFSTGSERNLRARRDDPRLHVVKGDVRDPAVVERLVERASTVYHLAAAAGVKYIVTDPIGSMATNVHGTEHVLAAAARAGARVVVVSSSEVYGRSPAVPFREDADRVLGPTWVHRWSYSTAKALDEHLAFAYADRGLQVCVVRYFNCYGPRIDENGYGTVVARFARQALAGQPITVHGDGRQTRSFTYVTDTVDGTVRAGTVDAALGSVFNIGHGREIAILGLAELIRDIAGSLSPIELVPYETNYPAGFQDTPRRVPDTRRSSEVLGFTAGVSLEDGLVRTLTWCREHYVMDVAS